MSASPPLPKIDDLNDVNATDAYAERLARVADQAAPATWERARLLPLMVAVLVVMMAQEGLRQMAELPYALHDWAERLGVPDALRPLVGLFGIVLLCWLGVRVYRRVMARAGVTGLATA